MKSSTSGDAAHKGSDKRSMLLVLGIIADVSWRMFVPVIGLTIAGYYLDKVLNSRPTGIIVCMLLGLVVAFALVSVQYKRAKKDELAK